MKNSASLPYLTTFILIFLLLPNASAQFYQSSGVGGNPGQNLTTQNAQLSWDKVGIGLDDPDILRKLHIRRNFGNVIEPGPYETSTVGIRLEFASPDINPPHNLLLQSWDLATGLSGTFNIYNVNNDRVDFSILKNSGYTGIGTSSPQGRLDVNSGILGYTDALFVRAHSANPNMGGIIHHQENTYAWQEVAQSTAESSNSSLRFNFVNRANPGNVVKPDVLVIHSTGRIGINKVSPDYTLDVDGDARLTALDVCNKIRAEEIEVQLPVWCDYVFSDQYQLRSISELEVFIERNRHLPEVPSEQEVLNKGINLGEMDAILLKKIEELTLYTIQQQKEIDELKKQIK